MCDSFNSGQIPTLSLVEARKGRVVAFDHLFIIHLPLRLDARGHFEIFAVEERNGTPLVTSFGSASLHTDSTFGGRHCLKMGSELGKMN
jgi:hypothetical protein